MAVTKLTPLVRHPETTVSISWRRTVCSIRSMTCACRHSGLHCSANANLWRHRTGMVSSAPIHRQAPRHQAAAPCKLTAHASDRCRKTQDICTKDRPSGTCAFFGARLRCTTPCMNDGTNLYSIQLKHTLRQRLGWRHAAEETGASTPFAANNPCSKTTKNGAMRRFFKRTRGYLSSTSSFWSSYSLSVIARLW